MVSDDRGQATVETALILPVIVLFLLLLAQVGVVVRTQLAVANAAREGARAAAVGADARIAAVGSAGLDPGRVAVSREGGSGVGELVTVVVTYAAPTDLPLVGALIGDVELDAAVTMRVER